MLLEPAPAVNTHPGGPGARYDLGTTSAPSTPGTEAGELPAHYDQPTFGVVRRDPGCLLVSWAMARSAQERFNQASKDGHLIIRLGTSSGTHPRTETHVHPQSRHWFVHVPPSTPLHRAELGYYDHSGHWHAVAGRPVPSARAGVDESVPRTHKFVSIPINVPLRHFSRSAQDARQEDAAVSPSVSKTTPEGVAPNFVTRTQTGPSMDQESPFRNETEPFPAIFAIEAVRKLQQAAWPQVIIDERHAGSSTTAFTTLTRDCGAGTGPSSSDISRQGLFPVNTDFSREIIGLSLPEMTPGHAHWSSASLARPAAQGAFPFEIEVDLIIRGSTHPDAIVKAGGSPVVLSPEGRFELRMTLPDGVHGLNVSATAADASKSRSAELKFQRVTVESVSPEAVR